MAGQRLGKAKTRSSSLRCGSQARIAQLVERLFRKQEVGSSILPAGFISTPRPASVGGDAALL